MNDIYRNSNIVDGEIVEKLKAQLLKREELNVVEEEIHAIERRLYDMKNARRMAKSSLAKLNTEEKILVREYWKTKG